MRFSAVHVPEWICHRLRIEFRDQMIFEFTTIELNPHLTYASYTDRTSCLKLAFEAFGRILLEMSKSDNSPFIAHFLNDSQRVP